MQSSFKKLPESAVELTVDIDLIEFKDYYARAFQAAKQSIEIKGFRKGMAPDAVLEGVLDPKCLFDDAAERAVKATLMDETEKNAWTIIDRPIIEIKDTDKSFSYVAKFSIFPSINIEGFEAIAEKERASLEKKKKDVTVKEEETKDALLWLQKAYKKADEDILPIDDAFAMKVGKFATLTELQESITIGIRDEKIHHEEEATCIAALEALAKKAAIEIPRPMIEKIREQDKEMTEEVAKKKIATHLVIYAIADKAGIRPTEDEIRTEIEKYGAGAKPEGIDAKKIHGYIYERIQQKKVYDYILKK